MGGGGRDGKLGGHIKTARGHRCWIICKVWPFCAPRAELETDRERKPRRRPRASAFTPTLSPLVRLEVSLKD
ncbi:hypothetical protein NQZ68_017389 [Dissostichus eleginoides]|nr:hypothetical protein NQZ68_017389 [Dissostichus eleginoides]